jgi:hypothetical protein
MPTPSLHLTNFAKHKAHPDMGIPCVWKKRGMPRHGIYKKIELGPNG